MRILLVDDEEDVHLLMRVRLRRAGSSIELVSARSGEEALDRIGEQAFDLVLSDWFMPSMGGEGLLSALAERPDAPRVIIVSGLDPSQLPEVGLINKQALLDDPMTALGPHLDALR